ncbi:acyltransferase family protein [Mucilaginibacter sp.]|uniref:acyltransferase family protein n=1 Tax=Mucilaginibacter sp. TaxID=1882438 RepID=UPI003D11D9F0
MTDKKNAFDLLRLLLALCVLITHGILLGGYKLHDPLSYPSKGQTDLAEFGVMGFFTLSGYLITASFDRAKNIWIFLSHRLLRIFPGFWVCLIITAFIIAPLIFTLSGRPLATFSFTGPESAIGFVYHNFLLKINQWSIKDLLNFEAYKDSLNGSLWSLFPEMQCYCFTLLTGSLGLFNRNKFLYLIFSITVFVFFAINFNFSKSFGPTILILSPALKLYASYMAGALLFIFRDQLSLDKKGTIFLLLFTLMLIKFGGYNLLSPLLIAMVLINTFQLFEFKIRYDVSYGLYIYSFPVQQLLFQLVGNKLPVIVFIGLALLISAILGLLSYILVERPFINLRKKTDKALLGLTQ